MSDTGTKSNDKEVAPASRSSIVTTPSETYPEGVRSRKLLELINKSLLETVHSFSYEKVATTFPELANTHTKQLKRIYSVAVTAWEQECKADCYRLVEKYDMRNKLNYIDHCIKTQVPILPPKLPVIDLETYTLSTTPRASELFEATPEAIIKATEIKTIQAELRRVKRRRAELEANNELLCTEITTLNNRLKGINSTFHQRLKTITSLLDFSIPLTQSTSQSPNREGLKHTNGTSNQPPIIVRSNPDTTEPEEFVFL